MSESASRLIYAVAFFLAAFAAADAQSQEMPDGWRAVADGGDHRPVQFIPMDPGWHLNPGPAALVYEPTRTLGESFRIEYDVFIFAGGPSGSGVFFGGRGLEPDQYNFFEAVLDTEGRYRLGHRAGRDFHEVVPWTAHEAITIPTSDSPALNRVVIDASPERLAVTINGVEVTTFEPPAYARFDGAAGIRVMEGANVHVTRLEFYPAQSSATR